MHADLGDLIPLAAVVMSLAIPIIVIIAQAYRRTQVSQMLHKERMLAMEKGLPAPSADDYAVAAAQKAPPGPKSNLRCGLLWGFIGLGLIISTVIGASGTLWMRHAWWPILAAGIICVCVGAAYLIFYFVEARKPEAAQSGIHS